MTTRSNVRRALAFAKGVAANGPSDCACCGPGSPFASAGKTADVVGPNFVDFEAFADASIDTVCEGCARLLGGKPSKTDPPLRMQSFALVRGQFRAIPRAEFWAILREGAAVEALSWATSMQRHHWLQAGQCSFDPVEIGSDAGTIRFHRVDDKKLVLAIEELAQRCAKQTILDGNYSCAQIASIGPRWADLEFVVQSYRGQPLLELLCWCAPVPEKREASQEKLIVIDPIDALASEILYLVAQGAGFRRRDGLLFWGSQFRQRLERCKDRPLRDMISKLMESLEVSTLGETTEKLLALMSGLTSEQATDLERAFRARPQLLVALAAQQMRDSKEKVEA